MLRTHPVAFQSGAIDRPHRLGTPGPGARAPGPECPNAKIRANAAGGSKLGRDRTSSRSGQRASNWLPLPAAAGRSIRMCGDFIQSSRSDEAIGSPAGAGRDRLAAGAERSSPALDFRRKCRGREALLGHGRHSAPVAAARPEAGRSPSPSGLVRAPPLGYFASSSFTRFPAAKWSTFFPSTTITDFSASMVSSRRPSFAAFTVTSAMPSQPLVLKGPTFCSK